MYEYDEQFYRYISENSARSARGLLPVLLEALPLSIDSVLDVGCGAGAWLQEWKTLGAEVLGLDGDYVRPQQLLVLEEEFQAQDLNCEFDLGRRFALAQSLEVAEHLPETSAAGFVASLCRHADLVLFSAAPPGQGGENHINEQPYAYWRDLFLAQGYGGYDVVRRPLLQDAAIMPWYRYNTFLYASERCPQEVKPVEVIISGHNNPANAWYHWQEHGHRFQPDLVVVGVTVGNAGVDGGRVDGDVDLGVFELVGNLDGATEGLERAADLRGHEVAGDGTDVRVGGVDGPGAGLGEGGSDLHVNSFA